ncbi:MAG: hypothetical protein ACN2B6_01370 [Rickettsiales bacterium]
MSFDYASLRDNTATRLITRFGREHTFTRIIDGDYDPASGTSSQTETTFTANVVKEEFNAFERSDSSVQVDDIKMIAEAATDGFQVGDLVTVEGLEYSLTMADPIKPGPTVVAWNLRARK